MTWASVLAAITACGGIVAAIIKYFPAKTDAEKQIDTDALLAAEAEKRKNDGRP